MKSSSSNWKRWVRWGVGAVLILDAMLVFFLWRNSAADPKAQRAQRDTLAVQHRLLEADVRKALEIQNRLPTVQQECDRFVKSHLLDSAGAYSTVVDDLDKISKKARLQTSALTFKQDVLEKRGVTQLKVAAIVEGDYSSLVRFINGLERSENFYLLDNLTLQSSTTSGTIRLNLELRSYFRP